MLEHNIDTNVCVCVCVCVCFISLSIQQTTMENKSIQTFKLVSKGKIKQIKYTNLAD